MLKLIILPPLYFSFMAIAVVVAFFTIEALILSYHHRVRSVQYITVHEYDVIGIAIFPGPHDTFHSCAYEYADDLQSRANWTSLEPANQICSYTNVTFYSHLLQKNRSAMVFNGPTLVDLKQRLLLHYTVDVTASNYSAIEYLLLANWAKVQNRSPGGQASYLSEKEVAMPPFTLPAGFRTWVKMSYTIRNAGAASTNLSDFDVSSDLASYNDQRNESERTTSPVLALFEWKGNTFEYVTEILSTTIWNTIGSLAGLFITLIKVGEYANRWIKRLRREKRKKSQKIAEIEEKHQKKLEQYRQRRMEKRVKKLISSSGYHE